MRAGERQATVFMWDVKLVKERKGHHRLQASEAGVNEATERKRRSRSRSDEKADQLVL